MCADLPGERGPDGLEIISFLQTRFHDASIFSTDVYIVGSRIFYSVLALGIVFLKQP